MASLTVPVSIFGAVEASAGLLVPGVAFGPLELPSRKSNAVDCAQVFVPNAENITDWPGYNSYPLAQSPRKKPASYRDSIFCR
jgi:hypothetical protein